MRAFYMRAFYTAAAMQEAAFTRALTAILYRDVGKG